MPAPGSIVKQPLETSKVEIKNLSNKPINTFKREHLTESSIQMEQAFGNVSEKTFVDINKLLLKASRKMFQKYQKRTF